MNFIVWILVGGAAGWIASFVTRTDAQQGLFLNVVVGLIGALIGGWLIAPLLGANIIDGGAFNLGSFVVSLVGAVLLLAVVHLVRRGRAR